MSTSSIIWAFGRIDRNQTGASQGCSLSPSRLATILIMVGRAGFEPTMYLTSRIYSPLASTNLHICPFLVGKARIELAFCPYQGHVLTIVRFDKKGDPQEIQTPAPLIKSQMLYQLS